MLAGRIVTRIPRQLIFWELYTVLPAGEGGWVERQKTQRGGSPSSRREYVRPSHLSDQIETMKSPPIRRLRALPSPSLGCCIQRATRRAGFDLICEGIISLDGDVRQAGEFLGLVRKGPPTGSNPLGESLNWSHSRRGGDSKPRLFYIIRVCSGTASPLSALVGLA